MSHAFCIDVENKAKRRNRLWYRTYLLKTLEAAKEKQVREIDASISLAKDLLTTLDQPLEKPIVVPLRELTPAEDDSLMKPVEQKIENLLYGCTEKGAAEKYLKARNKKSPEDKYFFRIVTSWDYGWQQKQSRVAPRDVNRGRCAILRDTFYRKHNATPDPPYYKQPTSGEFSVCSQYSC